MSKIVHIFTDASYSPQIKVGVGAYYITEDLNQYLQLSIEELKNEIGNDIQYLFFNKSQNLKGCTNIEINTINYALSLIQNYLYEINLYTDCQRALNPNLLNGFNSLLKIHKIKGHAKQSERNNEAKIFDIVDKAARKKLREIIKNNSN